MINNLNLFRCASAKVPFKNYINNSDYVGGIWGLKKQNDVTSSNNSKAKDKEYKNVYNIIELQLVKRLAVKNKYKNIADMPKSMQADYRQKAEYVTKMVIEKCEKYKVEDLAEVVAEILGIESGGYDFSDKVLKRPGSQFKGVMQVNLEACCILYGESCPKFIDFDGKVRSSNLKSEDYKGDQKRHCKQDLVRINKLKEKYPTPQSLYQAIQKDIGLGLEVGILFLKYKISLKKNNVKAGIYAYGDENFKKYNFEYAPEKINISKC